jgi:hypothetical protein
MRRANPTNKLRSPARRQRPGRSLLSRGIVRIAAPNSSKDPTRDSTSSTQRFLGLVAKIGSPIAIGTALLFYFGWVRANAQARALGYDVSMLGLSTTDFVLRSVSILFAPIIALILLTIVCYVAHPVLLHQLEWKRTSRGTHALVTMLRLAWLWCPLAVVLLYVSVPPTRAVVIPVMLTVAILLAMYGDRLSRHLKQAAPASPLITGLVLALLAIAIFWDVERIAKFSGEGYAAYISTVPTEFAKITIYSPTSLEMSASGIAEQPIGAEGSAYRYRYDGLRLLLHSGGKYFLLAYPKSGQTPTIVVLPDTQDIRVEFTQ